MVAGQSHVPGGNAHQHHIGGHGSSQGRYIAQAPEEQSLEGAVTVQHVKKQRAHQHYRSHREIALINAQGQSDGDGPQGGARPAPPDRRIGPKGGQQQAQEIGIGSEHIGEGGGRGGEGRHHRGGRDAPKGAADAENGRSKACHARQTQDAEYADKPGHTELAVHPQGEGQEPAPRLGAVAGEKHLIQVIVVGELVCEHVEVGGKPQHHGGGKDQLDIGRNPLPQGGQVRLRGVQGNGDRLHSRSLLSFCPQVRATR